MCGQAVTRVPGGTLEVERQMHGVAIGDADGMKPMLRIGGRAVRTDPCASVHHADCAIDDRGRKNPPMVVDEVDVEVPRPVDRRSERALPCGRTGIGIEGTRSRVRPPGNATPPTISGWASAPRASPGNGSENSRLIPRLRTAAAVSTFSSVFEPLRSLP